MGACPGLHIVYSPPTLAKLPNVSTQTTTHRCVPGDPNCTGADELKADFWSALGPALGAAAATKAAMQANLVFELETIVEATK